MLTKRDKKLIREWVEGDIDLSKDYAYRIKINNTYTYYILEIDENIFNDEGFDMYVIPELETEDKDEAYDYAHEIFTKNKKRSNDNIYTFDDISNEHWELINEAFYYEEDLPYKSKCCNAEVEIKLRTYYCSECRKECEKNKKRYFIDYDKNTIYVYYESNYAVPFDINIYNNLNKEYFNVCDDEEIIDSIAELNV